MKRDEMPVLSALGQQALDQYAQYLRETTDVSPTTIRNYVSDLRQFVAWCEAVSAEGAESEQPFAPVRVATPTITRYRSYLQEVLRLRPTTVNRALVSLKRYFAWAVDIGLLAQNPASIVKLVAQTAPPPRHLTDQEEAALVAAVTATGSLRDRTIIVLMLHTGLRAHEICTLRREQITLGQRSGRVQVRGKRNKYREVPLNATVRAALRDYLPTLAPDTHYLFPSRKTGAALTERALGYLVKHYTRQANLTDVRPHDLRHRFGYRMAEAVPIHRLAQIMGHDSLDTTMLYIRGTRSDLQREVEKIAWV
jgi:integrase/recombinase XerD